MHYISLHIPRTKDSLHLYRLLFKHDMDTTQYDFNSWALISKTLDACKELDTENVYDHDKQDYMATIRVMLGEEDDMDKYFIERSKHTLSHLTAKGLMWIPCCGRGDKSFYSEGDFIVFPNKETTWDHIKTEFLKHKL